MDADTVVLTVATVVVVLAQMGIVVTTRPRDLRDSLFAAVPVLGLAVLLVVAWRAVG